MERLLQRACPVCTHYTSVSGSYSGSYNSLLGVLARLLPFTLGAAFVDSLPRFLGMPFVVGRTVVSLRELNIMRLVKLPGCCDKPSYSNIDYWQLENLEK